MAKTLLLQKLVGAACVLAFLTGIVYVAVVGIEEPAPKGVFLNGTRFNFGVIDDGQSVKHVFLLKNTGNKDLVVKKLVSGCGCTGAKASQMTICPGQTCEIEVSYKGRFKEGNDTVPVWVETNDPKNPLHTLFLVGTIQPRLFCSPASIAFCYRQGEYPQPAKLEIRSRPGDLVRFEAIKTTNSCLTVEELARQDGKATFTVTFRPPLEAGNSTDYITFHATLNGRDSDITLLVFSTCVWDTGATIQAGP